MALKGLLGAHVRTGWLILLQDVWVRSISLGDLRGLVCHLKYSSFLLRALTSTGKLGINTLLGSFIIILFNSQLQIINLCRKTVLLKLH